MNRLFSLAARLAVLIVVVTAAPGLTAAADVEKHAGTAPPAHSETGAAHDDTAPPTPFAGTIAQSIAAIIVFLVVFTVLKQKAWGPIVKGLSDRENKIRRDIEEAEAARARSEVTLKEYQAQLATAEQKVREMLAKATGDAEQVAAGIQKRAQAEAEETKEKAVREIDAARRDAVRQVHEQAAVLATSVAEKILRRSLNADDQRDLVAASLDQLQFVKN